MKAATFARNAQKKAMDGARTAEIAETVLRTAAGANTAECAEIAKWSALIAENRAPVVQVYALSAKVTVHSATAKHPATIAVNATIVRWKDLDTARIADSAVTVQ